MKAFRKTTLALGLFLLGAAPATAQPVAERGPVTAQPEAEEESLQSAASVVVVNGLRRQGDLGGKLFGTAGGDPAMNGLYTYLAFYITPGDGWRIFRIGDFLDYRIVAETPGRVLIEVNESVMDSQSNISSRRRRLAISWTPGPDGTPPATIRVATAR